MKTNDTSLPAQFVISVHDLKSGFTGFYIANDQSDDILTTVKADAKKFVSVQSAEIYTQEEADGFCDHLLVIETL